MVGVGSAMKEITKKSNKEGKPPNFDSKREDIKGIDKDKHLFDSKCIRMGETISAGCQASARGLAKLAQLMANRGSLNGQHLISE